jgi:hypothetical protein
LRHYAEGIKESLSLFSFSALKKWFLVVIPTCAFFILGMPRGGAPLEKLFGVVGYIGYMFATGIPFVVGASLLLTSPETQNKIADSIIEGKKMSFRSLFTSFIIIMLLMMTIVVLSGLSFVLLSLPLGMIPLTLFALLVSTFAATLLVCPIVAFLTMTVDNWKISTFLGILLFLAIALATGTPGYPVDYPELAFIGPAHIVAALFFIMVGGFIEYPYVVGSYVGVDFQPIQLVIPIIILVMIGVFTYVLAGRMYNSNLARWVSERELWLSPKGDDKQWLKSEERTSERFQSQLNIKITQAHNALKKRQQMASAIIVISIVLIPIGGIGYVSVRHDEWTKVVYQTSGLSLGIGEWIYGEFTGLDPLENINLDVGCVGQIIGGAGGSVRFNFNHRSMTLDEFLQLNETEVERLFGQGVAESFLAGGAFNSGWGGPIYAQQYVWALRFLEVGGIAEGQIEVSFQVIVRPV